MDKKIGNRTLM